jgi:hypothetical protein
MRRAPPSRQPPLRGTYQPPPPDAIAPDEEPAADSWLAWATAIILPDGRVLHTGERVALQDGDQIADLGWRTVGSMAVARCDHEATLLADGRVVMTGGRDDGLDTTATIEVWSPASGQFSSGGVMSTGRVGHRVEILGPSRLRISGGSYVSPPDEGPPETTDLDTTEDVKIP